MKTLTSNLILLTGALALPISGHGQTSETDERFARFLKRFPEADLNKDGILDVPEARSYQQKRKAAAADKPEAQRAKPTHADVSYGDHELQAFDLWLAEPQTEGTATPLCIYIHGGGFRGGDKKVSGAIVERFLNQGISFASFNYRLTNGGEFPYPVPMHDSARALQFIRSKAEDWNLDTEKIACYGGSAGAGISLWLAFNDDRADPESTDPIARQSTRIIAAGTMGGQSTYDMRIYREWFGVPDLPYHDALPDLYALQEGETADSPRVVALAEDASAINHLTKDDPPVYMTYNRPNTPVTIDTDQGTWVHHPLLGLKLQEAMHALELECTVTGPDLEDDSYEDIFDFLIKKLSG